MTYLKSLEAQFTASKVIDYNGPKQWPGELRRAFSRLS